MDSGLYWQINTHAEKTYGTKPEVNPHIPCRQATRLPVFQSTKFTVTPPWFSVEIFWFQAAVTWSLV